MKELRLTGYITNDMELENAMRYDENAEYWIELKVDITKNKGKRDDYMDKEWPPKEIEIILRKVE